MRIRDLAGCLLCLACSGVAVAWIMGQTVMPVISHDQSYREGVAPIAPHTIEHRITAIHIRPLMSEAVVEIEYIDFAGEPLEKRTLTLKKADYPRGLVSKFVEAVDAGLAHNRSGVVGGQYDGR